MEIGSGVVAGVDGCAGGWICALVPRTGDRVTWRLVTDSSDVLGLPAERIGIDIPIGLPAGGRRVCDQAARQVLGAARSSVFFAPPRRALQYVDAALDRYAEANLALVAGERMSRQLWGILPRIEDLDAALCAAGMTVHQRIAEIHPELSFRAMDPRVAASKRTAAGVGQRLAALGLGYPTLDLAGSLAYVPASVRVDDALDALAAAWSAARWLAGTHESRPSDAPVDELGHPMRMIT